MCEKIKQTAAQLALSNHHSRKDPLAQGDAAAILLYTNLFLRHCHPQAEKGGRPRTMLVVREAAPAPMPAFRNRL